MVKSVIVGLNVGHDGGAAIIVNGKVIAAIGEERLTRQKYTHGYLNALNYCLKEANISIEQVSRFIFSSYGEILPKNFAGDLGNFGIDPQKCSNVDHHLSHAYGAFCLSGFDEAIVVIIDGQGNNNDTESYFLANREKIEKIGGNSQSRFSAKGIGRTYEAVTNYLGWVDQHAGKTMGLAAYGTPNVYEKPLFKLKNLQVEGELNYKYEQGVIEFAKRNNYNFGPIYSKGTTQQSMDLAAYLQKETEAIIVELVKQLISKTGIRNVCLAGGVALNCNVNTALQKSGYIDNLFILPASSDRRQCLGNALYGYQKLERNLLRTSLINDYWGRIYKEEEILSALNKQSYAFVSKSIPTYSLVYEKQSDIAKSVAELIYSNKIVAWFQGKSEFGPRALGHRSIVCNPMTIEMKTILNQRVKHRENFRPFAPSCIETYAQDYFDIKIKSPFMLLTAPVLEHNAHKIKAIIHNDNTARIQTVSKDENDIYYDLINEFYKISGVPMVLNTSFNDQEPIVETPGNAVSTFLSTDIDFLAIGDYLAWKEKT